MTNKYQGSCPEDEHFLNNSILLTLICITEKVQHKNPSIFGFKKPCNSLHEGFLKQKMLFRGLL